MEKSIFEIIEPLLEEHYDKFHYSIEGAVSLRQIVDEAVINIENDRVIELIELLKKSINDNFDYLPEKYNFNPKDIIGEFSEIVVD